jgi:hypothetical protein
MNARRTFAHPDGGWSAVAVHVAAAEAGKEGFYVTLFPEGKAQVVFVRPQQLAQLVDMAGSSQATDAQLWDVLAKIPLEPLLPNRALAAKLRALLVDCATPIREEIRVHLERRPPPPPEPAQPAPGDDETQPEPPPPIVPKAL